MGYTAVRQYASYRDPDVRVSYKCEIIDSAPPPGWTEDGRRKRHKEKEKEEEEGSGGAEGSAKKEKEKEGAVAEVKAEKDQEWKPPASRSPIFRVTASDDTSAPIEGKTPGAPWSEVRCMTLRNI